MDNPILRRALMKDAKQLHTLINDSASRVLMLPRALNQIYGSLRDFQVLSTPEGVIVGCCALTISWDDLGEVRSLAVAQDQQGKGYGRRLVQACLDDARAMGLHKIFTLTYIPEFFARLGFHEVGKEVLPHKIWTDCINCPRFPNCDETALMLELE